MIDPVASAPDSATAPSVGPPRAAWLEFVHLAALCALVVGQPVLDLLHHNPGYLIQEGLQASEIVVIAALWMAGPPLALWGVELLARCFGGRARRTVHLAILGLLTALFLMNALDRPLSRLKGYGIPGGWIAALLGVAAAVWLMANYRRQGWVSGLLSLAAAGLVVFPVTFFSSKRIAAICFPPPPGTVHPVANNPMPIVMIVFDGFAGMTLLDERHEIDAVRYPNFARLAAMSRWYPNATTVHCRTGSAVPALLSGRLPPGEAPPVKSEYPVNLFGLLQDSGQYTLTVFEPLTRLCPPELQFRPQPRTPRERVVSAMRVLTAVYVHTSVVPPLTTWRPHIPEVWFGIPEPEQLRTPRRSGWIVTDWSSGRREQTEHFLECQEPTQEPTLRFLHVVLPHDPLLHFADGREYFTNDSLVQPILGTHGRDGEQWGTDPLAAKSAWRRYLLQAQLTDRFIGQLLDRLTANGALDRSLIVVTADHGMAFLPGESRREPEQRNLGALLPVPLFIKLPGQTAGERIDDNVETIDILPTIADAIDIEIPGPVDGVSLLDPRERPRPRKTVVLTSGSQLTIDPEFPEKYDILDDMLRHFGSGTSGDRLWNADVHPEWVGLSVDEFAAGPPSEVRLTLECGLTHRDDAPGVPAPGFYQGVAALADDQSSATLVVSLNGVVAGVTRTLEDSAFEGCWNLLIPHELFRTGANDVRFYTAEPLDAGVLLRQCPVDGLD